VFRVRDDASKAEVKLAVELMFEVKVEGVNLPQQAGQDAPASRMWPAGATATRKRTYVLENRAVDRLHRRRREVRIRPWHSLKMKPTSPGTRFVVKIDRSHLHKGGPRSSP